MNDFQLDFTETSTETWKAQILKELKDDSSKIEFIDKIEEISLDITKASEKDFNSEVINNSNNWNASSFIEVNDEKSANNLALKNLNQGYNELIFKLNNSLIDWNILLNEIEVEYIHTRLQFTNTTQLNSFLSSSYAAKIQ